MSLGPALLLASPLFPGLSRAPILDLCPGGKHNHNLAPLTEMEQAIAVIERLLGPLN